MRQKRLKRKLDRPYRSYRDARRPPRKRLRGKLFSVWSYDHVKHVLESPDFSRDFMPRKIPRRWLHFGIRGSVGRARGPEHDRMRRAAINVVRPAVFKQMRPVYRQMADELIDSISRPGTKVDLVDLAQKMTYNAACLTFGLEELMTDEARKRWFYWMEKFGGSSPFYTFAQKEVRETFTRITQERMRNPKGKPIDAMLADDSLSLEDKIIMVFFMLLSATITTTHALLVAIAALLANLNPRQLAMYKQRALDGDIEMLKRLEYELVRLYPPNISRPFAVVGEDVVLAGEHLPKGTRVMACWLSADCDEEYFVDPLVFNYDRVFEHPILGFSEGSDYSCVGKPYSEEIFVAFHTAMARIIHRLEVKELEIKGRLAVSPRRMVARIR
jgi:cytochrome P450